MAGIASSILIGLLSGLSGAALSLPLDFVTGFHSLHPEWVFALPLFGAILAHFGERFRTQDLASLLAVRGFPIWITLSSLLSHLGGASVGREGAIVQLSAGVSLRVLPRLGFNPDPASWLRIGVAGGFAAATGVPLAGAAFSLELFDRTSKRVILLTWLAAFTGAHALKLIGAHPLAFATLPSLSFGLSPLLASGLFGVLCGSMARAFQSLKSKTERRVQGLPFSPATRGFLGGLLLCLLLLPESTRSIRGLGLATLEAAFASTLPPTLPFLKLGLTVLSLAVGFRGGEFIPLVFMGVTAGNLLSDLIPLPVALLPALGSVLVFGAAARMPLTALLLAIGWFGPEITPYALTGILLSQIPMLRSEPLYGRSYWTSKRSPET
jgi:H+/Cl- antiporter ClcA